MSQQTGAHQQHIAVERGIVQLEGDEHLIQASPQRQIRALALQQQVSQPHQQYRENRDWPPRDSHCGASGAGASSGRP